jgi:hypothetical protein
MPLDVNGLPQVITAIGGLGTAAFGLVEATKAFGGGVNRIGFNAIRNTVSALTQGESTNALSQDKVLATLKANWYNGTDLEGQKAIAKSLIKLKLSSNNAAAVAGAAGVNADTLAAVARKIATGTPLSVSEGDVYARFDFIVTALLDETYQRSDNDYRNWTRAWAAVIAILLAVAAGQMLSPKVDVGPSILVGLLATPLAPIAKDLSTALASAVNAMQLVKK